MVNDDAGLAHALMLDADPATRTTIAEALYTAGCDHIDTVATLADALAATTAHPYDVVVINYNMAGLDAIQTTLSLTHASPASMIVGALAGDHPELCDEILLAGAEACFDISDPTQLRAFLQAALASDRRR